MTADNEFYVTGRIKDLLIIRGTNVYPHDLELTAEQSHPSLQPNAGVAFSLDTDTGESVIILQELRRIALADADYPLVADSILNAIGRQHGLAPATVVLLRPGGILKTTSGKVQRSACRRAFVAGNLSEAYRWAL